MRLEWRGGSREIGDRPVLVGRDPVAADVAVEHDSLLSRLHFAIVPGPDSIFLLDLRSSNGTFVNGSRVHYSRLRDGDQIRAGTGRFEFHGETPHREPWQLLQEPKISFLAGSLRDPYLRFLRDLLQIREWEGALQAAAEALLACAQTPGGPPLAAFALGLEEGDPTVRGLAGSTEASLAEVIGPLLVRARQLDRPFLIEDLGKDLSFLPAGYPIRISNLGSVVAAPLGPQAKFGVLCLRSQSRSVRLDASHLVMIESFALSLLMGSERLRKGSAQERD